MAAAEKTKEAAKKPAAAKNLQRLKTEASAAKAEDKTESK